MSSHIADFSKNESYFHIDDFKSYLEKKNISYNPDSLKKSFYRLSKKKIIYPAGRGWYSTIKEELILDAEPVKDLYLLLKKKFPLLLFSLWSTQQIKEFFHHLPTRFLTFIYADKNFLSSIRDFLEEKKYNVFLNPLRKEAIKFLSLKDNLVILRPKISYRKTKGGYFKSIEQIIVDLFIEMQKIHFLDLEEYHKVVSNTLLNYRINISKMLDYAHYRKIKVKMEKVIYNILSTKATQWRNGA